LSLQQSEERVETVEYQLASAERTEMRKTKLNAVIETKENEKNKINCCGWFVYTVV
jgi:hypothetical protein